MGGRRKRSRKRSAASSEQQPDSLPTYFIERSLGRYTIANALRAIGRRVEVHDDHLAAKAPDQRWIKLCGDNRWLAITKDRGIRYREWERRAIVEFQAKVYVIRPTNLTGHQIGELLVRALNRIEKFAHKNNPPFLAAIYRDGSVKVYELG